MQPDETFSWATMPFHFWSAVFFALGCIVGSFLNVCIYRMPRDLSIVNPPSYCPHCKYAIPFYLNVPLFTWLFLQGKCKNCGAPIAPRYFIVEFITGVAFLACWLHFGWVSPALALVYSIFLAGLIVATFIDFEHYIIPDEITMGGAVVGFGLSLLVPEMHDTTSNGQSLGGSLLGIVVGSGVIYGVLRLGKLLFGQQRIKLPEATTLIFTETALHLPEEVIPYGDIFYRRSDTVQIEARRVELVDRSYFSKNPITLSMEKLKIGKDEFATTDILHLEVITSEISLPREAMGLGDVKFMATIGAFLGWQGAVFSLMGGSVIGAVIGLGMMLFRRSAPARLAYGPYLAMGAVIWLFERNFFSAIFTLDR